MKLSESFIFFHLIIPLDTSTSETLDQCPCDPDSRRSSRTGERKICIECLLVIVIVVVTAVVVFIKCLFRSLNPLAQLLSQGKVCTRIKQAKEENVFNSTDGCMD